MIVFMTAEIYSMNFSSENERKKCCCSYQFVNHIAKLIDPKRYKLDDLTDKQKENIIYSDAEYVIIGNKAIVNNLCAIKDNKYSNKYLIIYTFIEYFHGAHVYCFITYFDNDRYDKYGQNPSMVKYFLQQIMRLSDGSSIPNSENLYFYDDVLLMCDMFNRLHNFILRFTKFGKNNDTRITSYADILWADVKYSTPLIGNILFDSQYPYFTIIEMSRKTTYDLCGCETQKFNHNNNKYVIIDMLSLVKNDTSVMFTTYSTDDYLKVLPINKHVEIEKVNMKDIL